jgi:hypothetical protein
MVGNFPGAKLSTAMFLAEYSKKQFRRKMEKHPG